MNTNLSPYGLLLMRIALGVVLLSHSLYLKMVVFTLAGTANYFDSIGLPGWFAYVVFFVEAIAGISLIIGFKTRLSAALVVPILLGATWAHSGNGWLFTAENGGWEYPLFLSFIAAAVALTGPGAYALESNKLSLVDELSPAKALSNH
ncbi:DoxX family protein [Litoribrevibacter albus]|uniref:Quinol oxidase n=1 Tax=Litoribrevibacter albus TaxID=1473156 RepID=A0AA37S9N4_9GAMM|nr:DoxX family protein [Litoribrevibacter albus]GLQ30998.1 quinol oxidase [Litoribrevibacter albus]